MKNVLKENTKLYLYGKVEKKGFFYNISNPEFSYNEKDFFTIQPVYSKNSEINQFEIMELSIQSDHIHILLSAKPRYSPSQIVQFVKGGSSYKIRREFPELQEFLWGDSFWADGYFVSTHSVVSESVIRNYIKKQDEDR